MRWLPLWVVVLFLVIGGVWLKQAAPHAQHYPDGCSFDAGPQGLSQARAYLAGPAACQVETLTTPLALATLPADAVLLRIAPRQAPLQLLEELERSELKAKLKGKEKEQQEGEKQGQGQPKRTTQDQARDPAARQPTVGPSGGTGGQAQKPSGSQDPADDPHPDDPGDDGSDDPASDPDQVPAAASAAAASHALLDADEADWVASGGRLVLAIDHDYGPIRLGEAAPAQTTHKVFPILPGVQTVDLLLPMQGVPLAAACTVFAIGERPAIAVLPYGHGEVWLLSCPGAFFNQSLAEADHLRLLLGLVAGRPHVVIDEYAHDLGDDLGLFTLLRRAGLGLAVALSALAGFLWLVRRRILIGPETRHVVPPSTEAVDGVAAIGALYAHALDYRDLLTAHYQRLLRRLQDRHPGHKERALAEADRLLDGWRPERLIVNPSRTVFQTQLRRLNDAFRSLHEHSRPHL